MGWRTLQTTPSSPGWEISLKKHVRLPQMFMSFFSRAHTTTTPALRSQALCNLNFLSHGVVGCVCFPPGIRQRLDIKGLLGQPELASACDTSSLVITLLLAALSVADRKMLCAPTEAKASFQMQRCHPWLISPPISAYTETREGAGAAPRTGSPGPRALAGWAVPAGWVRPPPASAGCPWLRGPGAGPAHPSQGPSACSFPGRPDALAARAEV